MPNDSVRADAAYLSHDKLLAVLDYNPETGDFRWRVATGRRVRAGDVAGHAEASRGYIEIRIGGKKYKAHRLAVFYMTGAWPEHEVDHINGSKTDNRFVNLRLATREQNQYNRGILESNTSGVTGVCRVGKSGKWMAYIGLRNRLHRLGEFDTLEQAARVRLRAEKGLFGEFAPSESRAA